MKVTHTQKLQIVRLHRNGVNAAGIISDFKRRGADISRDNVRYWIKQYNLGVFCRDDKKDTGVTFSSVSQRESDRLEKNLIVDGYQSCRNVHNDLVKSGSNHSITTTRRLIKELGLTNSTPRYGQMVRVPNKGNRVKFCEALIEVKKRVLMNFDYKIFSLCSNINYIFCISLLFK